MQTIATDAPFDDAALAVLAAIADLVIPADEALNLPAASDAAIFTQIISRLTPHAELVNETLTALEAQAADFAKLNSTEQLAVVDAIGRGAPLFELVSTAVVQSYYADPRVLASLQLKTEPPFPAGNDLKQGDWALLDPVKARPKFYRTT